MSDLSPEEIINRLRQTIRNGKLGKDYTIKPREKNNLLREQYLISDEKIDEILFNLDRKRIWKNDNHFFPQME